MKKTLSVLLTFIMLLGCTMAPMSAYAAPKAPKATSISRVTAQSCAFKITWKTVKKVSGYQVQYSTSKKYTKKTTKTVRVNKASSKSKTVKKLKSKKKYYVRVRTYKAYKSGGKTKYKYSKYTKTKTVTTKPSTSQTTRCTNNNNHSMSCGNMGRWFNSRSEVQTYVSSVMESWSNKFHSGEITREEYYNKCPSGYKAWSCSSCGKWTGNFTY